ncbi:Glycosyltransferase involved in cell wall bisynthesis [Flavobacterium fluvii]|uniref:Glycosyltransferase involved in cell wall bisynthesis n=1 Tax=Flavobacterium fluvii TaxID=468056 RepID=A0A1M5J5K5_9FLAO|nr:glycosyltransferase [Flavobacterium fluvii]SHG35791.1 Glycosyltransferase involved in cell wall bisynthesis [Flavobacterium fluvii]
MQKSDLVTVICSCYNHARFVSESIESVLNQSHTNIQLIIIDDCSTDDSVAVIEKFLSQFPQILFIKNETNLGITKSFNNAIRFAKGDYILDLSADDVLLPNCIGIQLETFYTSKMEDLAIVFGNAELIAENGVHNSYFFDVDANYKTITKIPVGDIYSTIISTQTIICSVSAMIKKSYFDILKGYDESLSYEDFDFWIRIARHYNIDFVDAVLVKKRIVSTSLHSSFSIPKNINGFSTYLILKKAFFLNRNKKENRILSKRVNNEIKFALKTRNFPLAYRNILLRIKVGLKSL